MLRNIGRGEGGTRGAVHRISPGKIDTTADDCQFVAVTSVFQVLFGVCDDDDNELILRSRTFAPVSLSGIPAAFFPLVLGADPSYEQRCNAADGEMRLKETIPCAAI